MKNGRRVRYTFAILGIVTYGWTALSALRKVLGFIEWSWWWILSPIWIPIGSVIVVFIMWFLGLLYLEIANKELAKWEKEDK